jgi:hypothetical protein
VGSDQSAAAQQSEQQNIDLSNNLYGIAAPALSSSMSYLTQAYGKGQMLGTGQKYQAETTNFLDQSAGQNGSFLDPKAMGNALSGRAAGLSGIGTEQIGGAVDQMNQIRSLLAGQGMNTTNMAGAAGGLETSALKYMNSGNQTGSEIKGAAGGASALWGAGQKAGWWGQASSPGGGSGGSGGDPGGLGGGGGAWGGGGF